VLSVAIGHTEFRCCECRCTVRAETWMRQLCVRYVLGCSEYGAVWSVAMKQLQLQRLHVRLHCVGCNVRAQCVPWCRYIQTIWMCAVQGAQGSHACCRYTDTGTDTVLYCASVREVVTGLAVAVRTQISVMQRQAQVYYVNWAWHVRVHLYPRGGHAHDLCRSADVVLRLL
jgi:hypothetical protein